MKNILTILFLLLNLFVNSQQIVKLCDDTKTNFVYKTDSGLPGIYTWSINATEYPEQSNTFNVNWRNFSPGIYTITVFFESLDGCFSEPQITFVTVIECDDAILFIPNTFTPDGDAFNNEWKPIGYDWVNMRYIIFNRWGQVIFESYDGNVGWDGTYAGRQVQDGTYIYRVTWENKNGLQSTKVGHIILLR
jgi:gliding motility-associated-like protein